LIRSKISRRYARALFSIGQEDGEYENYGQNLYEFAHFCAANNEFFQIISNRIFSVEDRKKVLEVALERSHFSDVMKNFLRLLIDKNRIGAIEEISDYYTKLTDEISNITSADIMTARPLKKEALDKLQKALARLTSKDVKMEVEEDKALIGGIVVKIGDLVLDGSVRAQLEGLKDTLKRGEFN
jgi:F-type H+-transporting ATPase subunit delta